MHKIYFLFTLLMFLTACTQSSANKFLPPDMQNCESLPRAEFEKELLKWQAKYKQYLQMTTTQEVKLQVKNIPNSINKLDKVWLSIYSYNQDKTLYFGELTPQIDMRIDKNVFAVPEDKYSGGDNLGIAILYDGNNSYACHYAQPTGRLLWKGNTIVQIKLFPKRVFNEDINEYERFEVTLVPLDKN